MIGDTMMLVGLLSNSISSSNSIITLPPWKLVVPIIGYAFLTLGACSSLGPPVGGMILAQPVSNTIEANKNNRDAMHCVFKLNKEIDFTGIVLSAHVDHQDRDVRRIDTTDPGCLSKSLRFEFS